MPPRDDAGGSPIRRHDDVRIPVGSETVAAYRYEPVDVPGPRPAVLMYIPYRNGDYSFGRYRPLLRYLATHGYEVIAADLVGTGESSGRKREPYTPDEGPQAAAIVEWLADREWTTGRVGMIGLSYGGITSLKAAAERPDALEAIVPIHAPSTGYRNRYPGGTFWFYGRNRWGSMQQALLPMPPVTRDPAGRWVDVWKDRLAQLREGTPFLFQFLEYDSLDAYWAGKDIDVERIDVPTLAVSGWRDYFTDTTIEYFDAIDAPKRLLLGPWRHTMPHRGREVAVDFRRQAVEWFDRFLKDEDNGALDHAPVEFWTEREGGGEIGAGTWRAADRWPAVGDGGASMAFALTTDGLAPPDEFDGAPFEREYEPDHTVGVHSAALDMAPPVDTTPDDVRSMSFETPPLDAPVETTGTGEVTLRITPTTADPTVAVRVIDVRPDGTGRLVTHGALAHGDFRANAVDVRDGPEELAPGEEYELTIPLDPVSHLFETGHRIRVAVSGGFFPVMLPPREHGPFTVRSSPDRPSVVTLPGRPRDDPVAFDDAIEMAGPDERVPTEPQRIANSRVGWDVTRHGMDDAVTVTVTGSQDTELPHVDATASYARRIETRVEADDPSTAVATCRQEIAVDYGDETVRAVATTRTSRDTGFATSTVTIGDQTVFDESWTR